MYLYSIKKRRFKNKCRKIIWFLLAFAVFVCFFCQKKDLWKIGKEEAVKQLSKQIVTMMSPGLLYEEDESLSIFESIERHIFPITQYAAKVSDYETDIESALSYEMILAREALDENYVDENGQVVIRDNLPEDSKENEMQEETAAQSTQSVFDFVQDVQAQETADEAEQEADIQESAAVVNEQQSTPQVRQKQVEYSMDKLADFDYLVSNFYQVDSTTTIKSDQLNVEALTSKDMKIAHDASTPQILIYHTHSLEGYADSVAGDQSTTVVGVGDYLTQILTEQYGYSVIHDRGEYDTVRDKAYSKAAPAVEKILAENPTIDVVIDLHRDGVGENTRLVTNIDGTDMAKVMFFNGLSRTTALGDISYLYNPYIADNLAFSFQMQLTAAEYYPGFTRKIYLKGYRFNMHYCPKTLLIEVGAQTNTVQEAMNAMVPLADVLNKVLTQ